MTLSPDSMTLREKLSESDKLVRELIHHLESGFIPRAHALRRTARQGSDPTEQDEVTDLTIRNAADVVIDSDQFSRTVMTQLVDFLVSIDQDIDKVLGTG